MATRNASTNCRSSEQDFFVVDVHGAPSEVVVFAYIRNATLATTFKIEETKCSFPSTCSETGSHGNPYCQGLLFCDAATGCSCDSRPMNEENLPKRIALAKTNWLELEAM